MKNITVIGAGTMGNGIAHVFAQNGFKVTLVDVSQDILIKALETIAANLDRMIKKGAITDETKIATIANLKTLISLEEAVHDADLVIEAAPEDLELKRNIFKKVDKACSPSAILASNTSSISITKIAAATHRPDKVIGMHFMNPVPVMKLVEVIRGYATSDKTTDLIMQLSKQIGKIPVEVNDYPGFVSNRVLMPMLNEAIYALYEGVAGVQEIDSVMKLGMSHPMGPLQLADYIGLDVCHAILRVLYEGLGNPKYAPCPLLSKMVAAGKLGVKSKEGFYDYSAGTKELTVSKMFQ
jgi:3-hydroxybutyryl-CoA dehydrogenase